MACGESKGIKVLLCFGLFLFSTSLCHCARLTRQALDKLDGNSVLIQSQAKEHQHNGRLSFGQKLLLLQGPTPSGTKTVNNITGVETDYQADVAWWEANQPDGQHDVPDLTAMERLLKMEPKVECTLDSMKLQIDDAASTPGSLLFVDRGSHLSPLPLSKLPSSCGYTIRSTQRELVLVAPYDGCFVALEEDSYVLPLLWWGLPVRMSCPLMNPLSLNPPVVTCNTEGMLIKTEWTLPVSNIKVKLNGNWQPLTTAANRCGFSTVEHPEGVVISARYTPCLDKKDGLYTVEVAGDGEATISCPSELPAQPEYTENPAKDPEWQSETPSEGVYPPSFLRDPHQALKPAKVTAPQRSGLPQNSNMPNKGPEYADRRFYPTFFYPYSANPVNAPAVPTVNPRLASSSVIQAATDKRWQNFFPFYAQPPAPKTVPTQPPTTKPPAAQFEDLIPNQLPSVFQKRVVPPANQPESQEKEPLHRFSFYPQINEAHPAYQKLPEKPGLPEAPQPEAQAQVSQPFYFYPQLQPEIQPATKPSTVSQPPQPEAPRLQVHQQTYLCPENQLLMDPNAALALGTKTFLEEVHKLCQTSKTTAGTNDETDAIDKQSTQPPLRHPQGQMYHYPQQLQPATFPSPTYMQQQVTVKPSDQKYPNSANSQPSNDDTVPQGPQLSSAYMQPVCCPQFCSTGLSDCCPQITFYQHLQITPAEPGSKDVPRLYPDLSFLPPDTYFEFAEGSARLSQKPTDAAMAQSATSYTSAPISLQPFPSGSVEQSYLQPPDGNPATPQGSNPGWTANRELLLYHGLAPNSQHSHWPHLQQNKELPNSQSRGYYSEPSKPLASGNDPVKPVVQYEPNNSESLMEVNGQLLTGNLNSPSWPNFMSNSQNSQQRQNKPPGKELDDFMVTFYRLQPAPAPTFNNSAVPKNSKPFMTDSKSKHEQLLNSHSEPGNHVSLLQQHGPPGRQPKSFIDSSAFFRDVNLDANFVARHQNGKAQSLNLKSLQGKKQLSKWPGDGVPSPLSGDVNYSDGNDDHHEANSGLPLLSSASAGPPLMFPPYKSSLGAAHLNPKFLKSFKDLKRSSTPLGSSDRVPHHIPRKMFKAWSSEAGH